MKPIAVRNICLFALLSMVYGCGGDSALGVFDSKTVEATPIPESKVPSDWKRFELGPFLILGPSDLKDNKVQGIDTEVFEFENNDFSVGVERGMYVTGEPHPSYEYQSGQLAINGKVYKYLKTDLNKRAPGAAVNADGSKSPPIEKNLLVSVFIPEESAEVSVNFRNEESTQLAFAMLQSLRLKKNK